MSAHLLDESLFKAININDTIVGLTWWQGLHEMRYAAYDTTLIPNVLNLKDEIKPYLLLVFSYHLYYCQTGAERGI